MKYSKIVVVDTYTDETSWDEEELRLSITANRELEICTEEGKLIRIPLEDIDCLWEDWQYPTNPEDGEDDIDDLLYG
jgi:hypothetical protein